MSSDGAFVLHPRDSIDTGNLALLMMAGVITGAMIALAIVYITRGLGESQVNGCRLATRAALHTAGEMLDDVAGTDTNSIDIHTLDVPPAYRSAGSSIRISRLFEGLSTELSVIAARHRTLTAFRSKAATDLTPHTINDAARLAHMNATKLFSVTQSVMPLKWSNEMGIYVIEMTAGTSRVWAAFDSGSHACVLGAEGCPNCEPAFGAYAPPQEQLSEQHRRRNGRIIRYGSQTATTTMVLDTVSVAGFDTMSEIFHDVLANGTDEAFRKLRGGAGGAGGAGAQNDLGLTIENSAVPIYAAHDIDGTSASVLGVAPASSGKGWIEHVVGPGAHTDKPTTVQWGCSLGERWGIFTLGPPPRNCTSPAGSLCDMQFVQVARPPHLQFASTLFYMVPVVQFLAGPDLRTLKRVHAPTAAAGGLSARRSLPTYLMLDTGSTLTYATSDLYAPLRGAGVHGRLDDNLLVAELMEQGGGRVFLVIWDPAVHQLDGITPALNTQDGSLDGLLGVTSLLVGAVSQRGMYIHHDVTGDRLGFANTLAYNNDE